MKTLSSSDKLKTLKNKKVLIFILIILVSLFFTEILKIVLNVPTLFISLYGRSMSHGGDFDKWWTEKHPPRLVEFETHEEFYSAYNISKDMFLSFPFPHGIEKGDTLMIANPGVFRVGDVVTFKGPIPWLTTHRIIGIININGTDFYQTKGDGFMLLDSFILNESEQLYGIVSKYNFTLLSKNWILGKSMFKVPSIESLFLWG